MDAIFATDAIGGYAYKGSLPWNFGKYPDDKNWYTNKIRDKKLVMGRLTWESMSNSWRELNHNRCTIVASPKSKVSFEKFVLEGDPNSFKGKHVIEYINPTSYDDLLIREVGCGLKDHIVIGGCKLISSLIRDRAITVFNFTQINEVFLSDQRIDPDHESSTYEVVRQYEYEANGIMFAEQYLK